MWLAGSRSTSGVDALDLDLDSVGARTRDEEIPELWLDDDNDGGQEEVEEDGGVSI